MRFEAKHSYFKAIANRIKCFKNICKSMATHHQHLMCYYFNDSACDVLAKGINFAKGKYTRYVHVHVCIRIMYINRQVHQCK